MISFVRRPCRSQEACVMIPWRNEVGNKSVSRFVGCEEALGSACKQAWPAVRPFGDRTRKDCRMNRVSGGRRPGKPCCSATQRDIIRRRYDPRIIAHWNPVFLMRRGSATAVTRILRNLFLRAGPGARQPFPAGWLVRRFVAPATRSHALRGNADLDAPRPLRCRIRELSRLG
jgi:hypothetical protein